MGGSFEEGQKEGSQVRPDNEGRHEAKKQKKVKKKKLLELCSTGGSNSRPSDDTGNYETDALPTELVKQLLQTEVAYAYKRAWRVVLLMPVRGKLHGRHHQPRQEGAMNLFLLALTAMSQGAALCGGRLRLSSF